MSDHLLVLNADDFGLSDGVCREILSLGAAGALTSTSVLAVAPCGESWAAQLGASGLGIGAHLALVGEDPPLLGESEVPSLCTPEGNFFESWKSLVPRLLTSRVSSQEVHDEWSAQIQRLADWGLSLDHLNTHQHVHLWPQLAEVIVELALRHDLAVRVPCTETSTPTALAVRALSKRLQQRLERSGVRSYPSLGIDAAGHVSEEALLERIASVAAREAGIYEIAMHPGPTDSSDLGRYRWNYEWGVEAAALRSPDVLARTGALGLVTGTL